MNKVTINNYNDLIAEKQRLQLLLELQKERFSSNFKELKDELKEDLKPATTILQTVGKLTKKSERSKTVVNLALDYGGKLLKNTLLKKVSWPLRIVIPFFAKNIASHLIADSKNKKVKEITDALP
jgi:hypothetical protein